MYLCEFTKLNPEYIDNMLVGEALSFVIQKNNDTPGETKRVKIDSNDISKYTLDENEEEKMWEEIQNAWK